MLLLGYDVGSFFIKVFIVDFIIGVIVGVV